MLRKGNCCDVIDTFNNVGVLSFTSVQKFKGVFVGLILN